MTIPHPLGRPDQSPEHRRVTFHFLSMSCSFFPFWAFACVTPSTWNSFPPTSHLLFSSFISQLKCPLHWKAVSDLQDSGSSLASCICSIDLLIALYHNCLFPYLSSRLGSVVLKSKDRVVRMSIPSAQHRDLAFSEDLKHVC